MTAPTPSTRTARGDERQTFPKVSVLIPSYQHEAYIAEAIRSVAAQTYPNVQLVIVDDGSSDNSVAVIEQTLADVALDDVIFVQQPNGGAHAAFNRALELATGAYVSLLNSDDTYHPHRLERLQAFAESGGHEFVFSEVSISEPSSPTDTAHLHYTTRETALEGQPSLSYALLRYNGAITSSNFFLTTDLARRLGGFRDLVLVNDWDFLIRAIRETEPAILREPLMTYRVHPDNTIRASSTLKLTLHEYRDIILGYFGALRRGEVRNPAAPAPGSPDFDRFLDEPTPLSSGHWIFPRLRFLWLRSGIDLPAEQDALTPPDELVQLVGSLTAEGFHEVGEEFLNYMLEFAELQPTDSILDIGCGSGRMAIPLTRYLDAEGSYTGFDIVPDAIDWCNEQIASKHPAFSFYVADVRNSFYNPDGPVGPEEFRFPHDDNSFDVVLLTSVFTHLLPEALEQYVREIARVLKPGGRCLSTFFLDNEESRECLDRRTEPLTFDHRHGTYSLMFEDKPEFAVCYDEDYALKLLADAGLALQGTPRYGSWCGRTDFISYQDMVLTQKAGQVGANQDEVQYVCVSHLPEVYEQYVGSNPHVDPAKMTLYDNSVNNVSIPERYNDFIDNSMADGWVVFMHHDFSIDEPIADLLASVPRDAIFGVIGTRLDRGGRFVHIGRKGRWKPAIERGSFSLLKLIGRIKVLPELSESCRMGEEAPGLPVVDTVDCCCVIVHSSLIREHGLRFDPTYDWHFYSESFSLAAKKAHGIRTHVLQLDCGHYGLSDLDDNFWRLQGQLVETYGADGWASTCYQPPKTGGIERFAGRGGVLIQR